MILKICKRNYNIDWDVIFLTLVVNVNILRFVMNIYDTNAVLYLIYLSALMFIVSKNGYEFVHEEYFKLFILFGGSSLFYLLVSCAWTGFTNVNTVLKMSVSMAIAAASFSLPYFKIKKFIEYILYINIIYSIYLYFHPMRVSMYLQGDANYLNLTLTIGLALTISIEYLICNIYSKTSKKEIAKWLMLSILFFLALSKFTSRGTIILPVLVGIITILLIGKNEKLKSIFVLVFFSILLYFVIQIYSSNASSYAFNRMLRLFDNTSGEDRIVIWSKALNITIKNMWWLVGGGVNAYRQYQGYYPHNFFIQFIGEAGILALFFCITLVYYPSSRFLSVNKIFFSNANAYDKHFTVYASFGAFLYYLLTFSKSFSCYDGIAFFIMAFISYRSSKTLLRFNITEKKISTEEIKR